ncbi:hypothetical protein L9F63_002033, partial [Diploptera punctata]
FCEYLLGCPSTEVRSAFMKIIVFLAHFSLQDGPCIPPMLEAPSILLDPHATLSDHLLHAVLLLLHKEVSDHGRHLPHYFSLFHMYASLGVPERTQLLKLNVPATFMLVALDEGPGPPIKYQYPELTKLHQVVSQLIRCCDVSSKTQSSHSQQGMPPLPNPYGDPAVPDYIMPIQPQAAEILFGRTSYIKKLIEDANLSEETVKLLQFCSWENPHFSRTVLSELLWQIAYAYCHELRHHMDLLLSMLLIEDSWQSHRIHNALKGVPEEREGLFDTIQRSKNHYQKRAYQCIKCMVTLFSKCRPAHQMLHTNGEVKRKWTLAVEWLQDELERQPNSHTQYSYNNWSPPTQSNESTNGYFLERSNSARKTLERACELCPEEEQEVEEMSEEGESPQPEEQQPPQQKVQPYGSAYPTHVDPTSSATTQRILVKRQVVPGYRSNVSGVQQQPTPGPSTSNQPQPGTSDDMENTTTTTQDSSNEGTLSNSNSSTMQQSPEQHQCEENSQPSCSTADVAYIIPLLPTTYALRIKFMPTDNSKIYLSAKITQRLICNEAPPTNGGIHVRLWEGELRNGKLLLTPSVGSSSPEQHNIMLGEKQFVCVSDYERHAFNLLPKNALDYYRSGAGEEFTLSLNRDAFRRLRIRPRCMRDVSRRNLSSTVLGCNVSMPVGVAPTAMQRMAHPDGECANARAVGAMGGIFILSTLSTSSLEEVAAAAPETIKWFQLYIYNDRDVTRKLVERAEKAGYKALVLTVDAPMFGIRNADVRNKFTLPPHLSLANFEGHKATDVNKSEAGSGINEYVKKLFDQSLTWNDVMWLKGITKLPLVLKGILTAEDAIIAADLGSAGILVSNHGARQVDCTPASIEALPEIVKAVEGRCEIYLDGGIRQGTDVFKALALGAKMVFMGRPALWGLTVAGEDGVKSILNLIKTELDSVLALTGCAIMKDIKKDMIVHESYYSRLGSSSSKKKLTS